MLTREDKKIAHERINQLRRNPPKVTQEHKEGARKMFQKHKEYEAEKDRDIAREQKAFSKDLAGFVYNRIKGVGQIFHGFGEGKARSILCSICEQHESQMFNMKDGKWYCTEHRWFGDLNNGQQQKERKCL